MNVQSALADLFLIRQRNSVWKSNADKHISMIAKLRHAFALKKFLTIMERNVLHVIHLLIGTKKKINAVCALTIDITMLANRNVFFAH